jgi:E3 ubiquitin-protein ligase TRIP12
MAYRTDICIASQTLEKLSEEMPQAIVREGGLAALLTYLDFFSIHVQRTAVTAAARCCQRLSIESFDFIKDVIPILKNTLSYADSRLVEQACLAITGIVESFRHHPDKLEVLLTSDLLTAIAALLIPGQNPNVAAVDPSTHPKILKLLSTAAKSSPEIAISLIESDIVSTLYNLLTGISPPSEDEGLQGVKQHLEADDMLVLNNLVHRSKDVVQETLSLIHELLPALPKDGIFDPKAHMHRSKKVKKEESAGPSASLLSASAPPEPSMLSQRASRSGRSTPTANSDANVSVKLEEFTPALEESVATASTSLPSSGWGDSSTNQAATGGSSMLANMLKNKKGTQERRIELLSPSAAPEFDQRRTQVNRFYSTLLPVLLDVYTASIGVQVRSKTFQIMLKIVYYCDKSYLPTILTVRFYMHLYYVTWADHPLNSDRTHGLFPRVVLLVERSASTSH